MPYTPHAPDERERSFHYKVIWLGVAGTLFWTANLFIGIDNLLSAILLGAMAGGPLTAALDHRTDEYFRSLCIVGMRWACGVLGAYVVALFLLANGDLAYGAGFRLGSGGASAVPRSFGTIAFDSRTFAVVLSLAFHAGYVFAWTRDRMGR